MAELTVFYNASCPVCRTEIEHYRKLTTRHRIDIAYADISGEAACPLDRQAMLKRLHVEDGSTMHVGAPAFLRLWPRCRIIVGLGGSWACL